MRQAIKSQPQSAFFSNVAEGSAFSIGAVRYRVLAKESAVSGALVLRLYRDGGGFFQARFIGWLDGIEHWSIYFGARLTSRFCVVDGESVVIAEPAKECR